MTRSAPQDSGASATKMTPGQPPGMRNGRDISGALLRSAISAANSSDKAAEYKSTSINTNLPNDSAANTAATLQHASREPTGTPVVRDTCLSGDGIHPSSAIA